MNFDVESEVGMLVANFENIEVILKAFKDTFTSRPFDTALKDIVDMEHLADAVYDLARCYSTHAKQVYHEAAAYALSAANDVAK